jgi:antitoxin component of RelBE/YafQ-DinJ toxin-antitoxin module
MAIHTIIIEDKTNKTRHLLGLIKEMAKSEKYIIIDPVQKPNKVTLQAIEDAENGRLYKAENIEDLFKQLNK